MSEISAGAIKEIERLVQEAGRSKFVRPEGCPQGRAYWVGPDGKMEFEVIPRRPTNDRLDTPEAFAEYVKRDGAVDGGTCFYGEQLLQYVEDEDLRYDAAHCPLIKSVPFKWLEAESSKPMTQAQLVRTLRIIFNGCLPGDSNLIGVVRNMKFDSASAAAAEIKHGRESLGRQIQASVTGEGAIPEEVNLFLPVYENFGRPKFVKCAIEVFPHEQQFKLTPYPGQLRDAVELVLEDVAVLLSGEGMPPAFRGAPG